MPQQGERAGRGGRLLFKTAAKRAAGSPGTHALGLAGGSINEKRTKALRCWHGGSAARKTRPPQLTGTLEALTRCRVFALYLGTRSWKCLRPRRLTVSVDKLSPILTRTEPPGPLDAKKIEKYPCDGSPIERAVIAAVKHDVQPLDRLPPSPDVLLGHLPRRQSALDLRHLRHKGRGSRLALSPGWLHVPKFSHAGVRRGRAGVGGCVFTFFVPEQGVMRLLSAWKRTDVELGGKSGHGGGR